MSETILSSSEDNPESFEEIIFSLSLAQEQDSANVSSTNKNEVDKQQTDELIYKLNWTTRDEIILNLNRYTQLLCGKKAETEIKEKLMYDNTDLYQILISLSLKGQSSDNAPDASCKSSKVVLGLDSDTRLQIVRTLIANQSLVVDGDSTREANKMNMIKQNNEVIVKLVNLPFSVINGPSDESALISKFDLSS